MRRIIATAIACIFAGVALAGCTGGDNGNGGNGGGAGAPQATVVASPLAPNVGDTVTFEATAASASDTVSWHFGDGQTGTGARTTHTYEAPGQYIVLVNVTNADGRSATNDAALTYLTVSPADLELENVTEETAPLVAVASSAQVIRTGGNVTFDTKGSGAWEANPDFDATNPVQNPGSGNEPFLATGELEFTWDFGDGETGTGPNATHTFDEAGIYPVKVTGTAPNGKSSTYIVTVRVLPEPPSGTNVRNPGTYLHATIGEPESLDPAYDYETAGGTVIQQVYETLYFYERDSAEKLKPVLASAMPTYSEDKTELTIPLRQNVQFHDGTTMTAEDVKFSLDRIILMNDAHGPAWIYTPIAGADEYFHSNMSAEDRQAYLDAGGVTVVDDHTVKIKLAYPDPSFLYRLAYNGAAVVSKDGVCAHAESDFVDCLPPVGETRHPWMDSHEVGSGPFMLDAWIPGQQVILKRFDGYWGTKPALEKVIIQKVEDVNTRLLMLFSGQADSVYVPVDQDTQVLGKESEGIRIIENPSWTVGFLGLNQKFCGGPESANFQSCMDANGDAVPRGADGTPDPLFFNDINMRKAWTYAFDYDTYFNDILKGHGRMLNGPLPKGIFGYDDTIPQPEQDMEKAREFLQQTNHSDGFQVTIFYNSGNTVREKTANLLAQNLRELSPNAKVDVKGLDWSTAFLPKQRAQAMPVFYLGWAPDYAFPDNYVHTFAHSDMGIYSKRIGYENPALDAKLDELLKETDEQALREGYSEAVKQLNEDYVFIWLAQASNFHVERDWVNGYYYNPMHSGGPGIGDYSTISKG